MGIINSQNNCGLPKLDFFCESIYEIVEDKKVLNNISQTYFELIASH